MDEKDFFDRFIRLLTNIKDKYDLETIHDALIVWFGENYINLDPEDVKERIVKDSHAEGVDAVLLDQIHYKLIFITAKTVENFDNSKNFFPENDVKATLEGIRFLLKGDYKGKITPELENLIDEYHELDQSFDYKTEVIFLALKKEPADNKFIELFLKEFEEITVHFLNFDWIFNFYVNTYMTRRAPPPEKISFRVITDLFAKDTPYKSRVFTCKGEDLAKMYNDYRERIFQQNVRYSLGLRSKSINRQILETAKDAARSEKFWYFNNGITIVCDEIHEAASKKVINLKNAQIINGAQTTYALHEAYQDGTLNDNVEVLVKAIETNDRDFIENVTLYTNSQNAIRLRDLCSNDDIQFKIQRILLGSYKYFFERKRGEFDSLYPNPTEKKEFLGSDFKLKVISNENAAQSFLAMHLNKPAQAKSEKGRIFMKDTVGFYDDIFNKQDTLLPEKFLLAWKLLKYIEEQKKVYKYVYRIAEGLSADEKAEIYERDFLLHSEYFILNIFKDFLRNRGFDFNAKNNLLEIISQVESNGDQIKTDYNFIVNVLTEFVNNTRTQPGYYHNKFFKSEKSIGLVRNYFNQKFGFIEVIQ